MARLPTIGASITLPVLLLTAACLNPCLRGQATEDENFRRGLDLYTRRMPAQAAAEFERTLQRNPRQPRAAKLLGLCYHLLKDNEKAKKAFLRATELDPKDTDPRFFLGRLHYHENFFEGARGELNAALKLNPRDSRARGYLALTLEALGEIGQALAEHQNAVRLNAALPRPDFRPPLAYGALLLKLNRLDESERQLLRAKQIDSTVWETHFELGKLYHRRGQPALARNELEAAIRSGSAGPEDAERIRHLLSRVYPDPKPPGDAAPDRIAVPVVFESAGRDSGLDFVLDNHATPNKHQIETMPAGVGIIDYDNDGFEDVFFINGASVPALVKTGRRFWNRLYRNKGDGTFADLTAKAGVAGEGYGMAVAVGDFDNDGWSDLFVAGVNRNILYRNLGDGTFADVTRKAGVSGDAPRKPWSISAGWFDYNNDSHLDLFVVNYCKWDPLSEPFCGLPKPGYRSYCHPRHYEGLPNNLYRNNGDGTFTDVSAESGISAHIGKGMGVAFADYDDDGWTDVFVCNDTVRNFLFRNLGNGRFDETGLWAGVALTEDGEPVSSMGADFRDIDNDGRPDVFVSALSNETFPLFLSAGKGLFRDVTYASRIGFLSLPSGGFSTGVFDLNNDGWKDIFVAGSHVMDNQELFSSRSSRQPNRVFVNLGGGRFADGKGGSTPAVWKPRFHRGCGFADLDNDGRIDIVVSALNEPAEMLRNRSALTQSWIQLELRGVRSNRDAIGAKIRILQESGARQHNHVTTSVGYASSSTKRVHFGLGTDTHVTRIEIRWPSGKLQALENVQARQLLRVTEPDQK